MISHRPFPGRIRDFRWHKTTYQYRDFSRKNSLYADEIAGTNRINVLSGTPEPISSGICYWYNEETEQLSSDGCNTIRRMVSTMI